MLNPSKIKPVAITQKIKTFPKIQKQPSIYKLLLRKEKFKALHKPKNNELSSNSFNFAISEEKEDKEETIKNNETIRNNKKPKLPKEIKIINISLIPSSKYSQTERGCDIFKEHYYNKHNPLNSYGNKYKVVSNTEFDGLSKEELFYREKEFDLIFENKILNKKQNTNIKQIQYIANKLSVEKKSRNSRKFGKYNYRTSNSIHLRAFSFDMLKHNNNNNLNITHNSSFNNSSTSLFLHRIKHIKTKRYKKEEDIFKSKTKVPTLKYPIIMNNILQYINGIIEMFLMKINMTCKNNLNKKVFVIVNGVVVINYMKVPGIVVEIPKAEMLQNEPIKKRKILLKSFLLFCNLHLSQYTKCNFTYVMNKKGDFVYDLADIDDKSDNYIFVSTNSIFKGISLPSSDSIFKTYQQYYKIKHQEDLENDLQNALHSSDEDEDENRNRKSFEKNIVSEIFFGDKRKNGMNRKYLKKKKLLNKNNILRRIKSTNNIDDFSNNNDYIYFSDNEQRKKEIKINDEILSQVNNNNIDKSNFLFIKLYNDIYDKRISRLTNKLKFSSNNKNYDISTLSTPETTKKYLTSRNEYKTFFPVSSPVPVYKHSFLKIQQHFHNNSKNRSFHIRQNINKMKNFFTHNTKRINLQYPHLFQYNIPNILNSKPFTKNDRSNLFFLFTQFKYLAVLYLDLSHNYQKHFEGIDFEIFRSFLREFNRENISLIQQIFTKINKSESGFMTLDEFLEGMTLMNKEEFREQIEFFISVFDQCGKGYFTFKDVKDISRISLKRLMRDNGDNVKEKELLNELGDYFAMFIYDLVEIKYEDKLTAEQLRQAVHTNNFEKLEYIKTFCCCQKIY